MEPRLNTLYKTVVLETKPSQEVAPTILTTFFSCDVNFDLWPWPSNLT